MEDPLGAEVFKGNLHPNEPVAVVVEEGKLAFKQRAADAPKALSS